VWGFEDTANLDAQTQLRQGLDPLFIHRVLRPGDPLHLLAIHHCGHRVVCHRPRIHQQAPPQQPIKKVQGKTEVQMVSGEPDPCPAALWPHELNLRLGSGGGIVELGWNPFCLAIARPGLEAWWRVGRGRGMGTREGPDRGGRERGIPL
jgi:hypothetical protein